MACARRVCRSEHRIANQRPLLGRLLPIAETICRTVEGRLVGRERSFKDGLTEQMNSFDEGRLSPISGRSPNQKVALVKDNNRPPPDLR